MKITTEIEYLKKLAERLVRLYTDLESKENFGPIYRLAFTLEDRIGSGHPFDGDIERAEMLLGRTGF
ncbi:hypothetical protein [Paraburkholderia sp. J12]|uniref:hypothetical protein n=1 Tax=Paraburkholderia sp. J12 TaxID=2805432 RepID=UPI002ABE706C|nr:hypothetical protein [Paraburkholderia sp. J12]